MKLKLFLAFLFFVPLRSLGQQTVFVKADENGNGFLREGNGECYVITPNHVVFENMGDIRIIAKNRLELKARLIESFDLDLAILRLHTSQDFECTPFQKTKRVSEVLENASSGFLEYRDEFGSSNLVHVNISFKDQESIAIIPQSTNNQFVKGMSGASFYVHDKGEKVLLGMLMNVAEDLRTGYIYQIDDMDRMLSPFFDAEDDKVKKMGILILKEGVHFTEASNTLVTNLHGSNKYSASKKLPNSQFLFKEFKSIVEGRFSKFVPQKIEEDLDVLLLGEVTIQKTKNSNNLYRIDARLAANLYSSSDFALIKNVSTNGKGLNSDENLAYDQSIKSLLNNLQKQLE